MKKLRNTIFLLIAVFFIGISTAYANEGGCGYEYLYDEDIPVRTYIIGTHMFNRDTNADYPGYLTTKLIMMGSRTIESDEELIIYYKTPNGTWINALDGSSINPKNVFRIEKVNTRIKDLSLCNPFLNLNFDEENYVSGNKKIELSYGNYSYIESSVGVEIERSENFDEESFALYKTINEADYDENEPVIDEVERGKAYYYRSRLFKKYSDKTIYSDYSWWEYINNADTRLSIENTTIDYEGNKVVKLGVDAADFINAVEIVRDGVEIIDQFSKADFDKILIEVPAGKEYELTAVSYISIDEEGYDETIPVVVYNETPDIILNASFVEADNQNYAYELSIDENLSSETGINIYYKEKDSNDEFTLLKSIDSNKTTVEIPVGKTYVYKAVLYNKADNAEGISSSEVVCYTSLETPVLNYSADYNDYAALEVSPMAFVDKIEVYGSETETGKFQLIYEVSIDELKEENLYSKNESTATIPVFLLKGQTAYYKVRTLGTVNGESKVSGFSNSVRVESYPTDFEVQFEGLNIYNNAIYSIGVEDYTINGIEIYYSEDDVEENYQLLKSENNNVTTIEIPTGKSYYVKVRTYHTYDSGKEYSEFLSTKLIENEYSIILDSNYKSYSNQKYLYDLYLRVATYETNIYLEDLEDMGMELYCSSALDGQYVKEDSLDGSSVGNVLVGVDVGEKKYCYVKLYEEVDGQKQYGVTTNTLELEPLSGWAPSFEVYYDEDDPLSVAFYLDIDSLERYANGIEFYTSDTVDGTYRKVGAMYPLDDGLDDQGYGMNVQPEKIGKFYKVRVFVHFAGTGRSYSEYSNAEEIKLYTPIIYKEFVDRENEMGLYLIVNHAYSSYAGIEVYYSTSSDGEYTLADLPNYGTKTDVKMLSLNSEYYPSSGETYSYKIRSYFDLNGTRIYSDFSDPITITNEN